uniref:U6 snRNA-associated Sm-like protein Lsm4 n=1 Tax=Saccharomyces cerevisiae (strain ATCC 204508 / S288c) TaxID=559292 RepID=UPI0003B7E0B6
MKHHHHHHHGAAGTSLYKKAGENLYFQGSMLPLYLLTNAKGQQMQIELKNGEIIQGILTNVDNWMNLTLSNVTEYSEESAINSEDNAESSKAVKLNEIYIRGTFIKFIKLQDNIIDKVKQQI